MDRPGDWGPLFDALYEEALAADDLVMVSAEGDDVEAYAAATERIIEEALKLADAGPRSNTEDQSVEARAAVVVWEGESCGDDDQTAHFANLAKRRGFRLVEIHTLEQKETEA